jgi:hypothetical protein
MDNTGTALAPLVGHVVRPEKDGKTKIIRVKSKARWTDKSERIFLEVLASTCNVRLAAAECGFSTVTVYKRRMRYPGFAALWAEAIEQGYARIEAMLVERATDSVVRIELDGDWEPEGPPLSNAEMMNLLKLHRASVRGGKPQNYGWASKPPDMDEVRKGILRKIEAIARHDEREAARKARREARAAAKMAGESGA